MTLIELYDARLNGLIRPDATYVGNQQIEAVARAAEITKAGEEANT